MFHSSGHFIILHLSFYYLLTLFWQISEKWLWHFWNTFVKGDTFVTHLWKIVTLLWRFCNLCNFIIFLLSFNYLVTLLWHFCDTFVKISGPQFNLSTERFVWLSQLQNCYWQQEICFSELWAMWGFCLDPILPLWQYCPEERNSV